jgi:hypothetical protein
MTPDDCLPCNFDKLKNLIECIRLASLALSHSWQEGDFWMPSINVRFGTKAEIAVT